MKKATEKQIEIESEIAESEILIETEPQPEQPEQPAQEPEQPTEQQPEQPASETQKKKRGRPKKKSTDSQTGEKTISENAEIVFSPTSISDYYNCFHFMTSFMD